MGKTNKKDEKLTTKKVEKPKKGKEESKKQSKTTKTNGDDTAKTKRGVGGMFAGLKKSKLFESINKNLKQAAHKSWDATKKYSKVVKEKTVSVSKTVFYASVKLGLSFSDKAQCPKCKTINEPISYVWQDIENGFNNVERPAPDFGKKENKYECKQCKEQFSKKMHKKEALCPSCGSVDCMMESDGDTNYIDEQYAKYEDTKVSIGLFKKYPWGARIIDLHQIYHCPKCDVNFWQHKSVSRRDCCPYCHALTSAKKRTYVEDVSTYSKSEVVAHRKRYVGNNNVEEEPIYGEVAYEHGYETTEYYCPECGEIVFRESGWYDRKL